MLPLWGRGQQRTRLLSASSRTWEQGHSNHFKTAVQWGVGSWWGQRLPWPQREGLPPVLPLCVRLQSQSQRKQDHQALLNAAGLETVTTKALGNRGYEDKSATTLPSSYLRVVPLFLSQHTRSQVFFLRLSLKEFRACHPKIYLYNKDCFELKTTEKKQTWEIKAQPSLSFCQEVQDNS